MLIVVLKMFTLKEANKIMAAAPRSTWIGDGFPPPPIHHFLLKGAKNKLPKKAGKMRYTASNMRKFAIARCVRICYNPSIEPSNHAFGFASAMHSVDLFAPLITDAEHPVWVSWVKHVEYVKLMVQDSYTIPQIIDMDKAIYEAQVAFRKVKQYNGFFKPKQHFASHASVNTMRMGPMRGYAHLFHASNLLSHALLFSFLVATPSCV